MLHVKDPSDVRYLLGLVTIVGVPLCQKVECSYVCHGHTWDYQCGNCADIFFAFDSIILLISKSSRVKCICTMAYSKHFIQYIGFEVHSPALVVYYLETRLSNTTDVRSNIQSSVMLSMATRLGKEGKDFGF